MKKLDILAIIGIVIAMGIAGTMDVQEEERQHAEYCEMVKLWKQTNGKHGWPDYDGIYDTACRR